MDYGKLAELAIKAAQRQKRRPEGRKRKGSGVAVLPGKLTDCESRDLAHNEVFLVEGDSAGGSAKMGRDKECQAVLPLRGKVLNTWEVERDRCLPTTDPRHLGGHRRGPARPGRHARPVRPALRQDLHPESDADVDGSHIQVLLLTLFFRHFPSSSRRAASIVARPPLFRVDVPARQKAAAKMYALDGGVGPPSSTRLRKDGVPRKCQISRFRGLGEMNAEQLWETTLAPTPAACCPCSWATGLSATEGLITKLMGRAKPPRRELMELHGDASTSIFAASWARPAACHDYRFQIGRWRWYARGLFALFCQQGPAICGPMSMSVGAHFAAAGRRALPLFTGGNDFDSTPSVCTGQSGHPALPGRRQMLAFSPCARHKRGQAPPARCGRHMAWTTELLQARDRHRIGFDAAAVSPKGAVGLMPTMPSTA